MFLANNLEILCGMDDGTQNAMLVIGFVGIVKI